LNESEKWDRLFKEALASTAEPDEELNERMLNRIKERSRRMPVFRKRISIAVLVAVCTLVMSITAVAATQFFNPKQVAEHLGKDILAKAFESKDAIEINQTVASGDYSYTLHGIVSGAGLEEMNSSAQTVNPARTYAVLSITRQDGKPMPATSDAEYGKVPFFVSPLIKGQKPWQVNIMTMHGGYSETVIDGIMYRLIECDGLEMFADRGVYLAVSSGESFYNSEAFAYNESTGEVKPNADYKGTSILFDLPLDKAKADHAKAEAYLKKMRNEPSPKTGADPETASNDAEADMVKKMDELKNKIPDGEIIPESVKEVTYDDLGRAIYEYDGWKSALSVDMLFTEGQTGYSDAVQFSEANGNYMALQFARDEKGVITGRVINLK